MPKRFIALSVAMLMLLSACGEQIPDFIDGSTVATPPVEETPVETLGPTPPVKLVEKKDAFQGQSTQKIDIAFVLDNSGSMEQEIRKTKENLGSFVDILWSRRDVDYRMVATTTDGVYHQGNLIPSMSNRTVITNSTPNAIEEMKSIFETVRIWIGMNFAGDEMGLISAELLMKNHFPARENASTAVIIVSDEEDQSYKARNNNNSPEYFAKFFKSRATPNAPVLLFNIVGKPGVVCNEIASYGLRYEKTQQLLGTGSTQSICNDRVEQSFKNVAQALSDRGICYQLSGAIVGEPTSVTVDGTPIVKNLETGYHFEAGSRSVCFTGSFIPTGRIEATYLVRE